MGLKISNLEGTEGIWSVVLVEKKKNNQLNKQQEKQLDTWHQ